MQALTCVSFAGLYAQFKAPGAFGGATVRDPWETLKEYKELLEGPEYNCDIVIPLQHTYVPDDHKTCKEFDIPVRARLCLVLQCPALTLHTGSAVWPRPSSRRRGYLGHALAQTRSAPLSPSTRVLETSGL